MSRSYHVLGLMSGTSCDGVDGVVARFETLPSGELVWEVLHRQSVNYSEVLRQKLLKNLKVESSDVASITQLHQQIGESYAKFCQEVMQHVEVDMIALSGQTIYHIPRPDPAKSWFHKSTLQIGEAALVAEACRVPVYSDFRQSDMAAGGQGAPLVAFSDLKLYSHPAKRRAIHNLGGISNLTYLPAGSGDEVESKVFAFDTGPANCLLDEAAERYFSLPYDQDGQLSAQGVVNAGLLADILGRFEVYEQSPPPKTTGRELFNLANLDDLIGVYELSGYDVMATLSEVTVEMGARAYQTFIYPHGLDEILIAGGGALNPYLMTKLKERLTVSVHSFEEVGLVSKDREALAFAVMAYYAHQGKPNTLPSATGARRSVIAGKLSYP
ncbi:MAG: anhydro-N-acetylmuramic acid kinase [Deinococcales bacterium]